MSPAQLQSLEQHQGTHQVFLLPGAYGLQWGRREGRHHQKHISRAR